MTSPCFLDANLRVKHEMHDIIGITEVKLRFVCTALEESIRRLHPICLDNLRFNARCKGAQYLIIFEHLDFCIDCCADFQAQNDCIVYFKLDADACHRSLFQRVFLPNELLNLGARLRREIKQDVPSWSTWALDLDFLELYDRLDYDGHGVPSISTHLSEKLLFLLGEHRVVNLGHERGLQTLLRCHVTILIRDSELLWQIFHRTCALCRPHSIQVCLFYLISTK